MARTFCPDPRPLIVCAISPKRELIWAWLQHVGVLGSTGWSCGPERAANWSKQDSAGLVFVFTLLERRPLEQTASVSSHVAENHPNLHSLLFGTTNTQPVCPDGPAFQISHCFCPLSPPSLRRGVIKSVYTGGTNRALFPFSPRLQSQSHLFAVLVSTQKANSLEPEAIVGHLLGGGVKFTTGLGAACTTEDFPCENIINHLGCTVDSQGAAAVKGVVNGLARHPKRLVTHSSKWHCLKGTDNTHPALSLVDVQKTGNLTQKNLYIRGKHTGGSKSEVQVHGLLMRLDLLFVVCQAWLL
ncbi:hypothetical protein Q8A67_006733 [Cirrhinus molitorella]|uniref:Uncharacterized protein n=1 Tax=Cirrhinus molitorella TaxID=172907 RepID=A0AA88PXC2_9TELE|nr:hypothetical protein Q8A67_006733 [Cirrhinus molitorella]